MWVIVPQNDIYSVLVAKEIIKMIFIKRMAKQKLKNLSSKKFLQCNMKDQL